MADSDEPTKTEKDEPTKTEKDEPTKTGKDDLNIEWDISGATQRIEPYQHVPRLAYGHLSKNSRMRYCIRYGSSKACSTILETQPPLNESYQNEKDVTKRSDRIIENIVEFHRKKKEHLPIEILSQAIILSIYWESKTGIGHAANVHVLRPDYGKRRPNTRCYTYLEPSLYSKYNLDNRTGYSHETLSTTKLWQKGQGDREKFIALHNISVELENKFEAEHMKDQDG
ncbi:hypothetical protein PMIN01_12169 [Paraphaeosphaeria minitans]|uniref:Uncharacterized protein n=1 Tax=Paraphaeosphaeria minitans TaxID=565426 RepID=A0A9P6G6W5_9PLEO|nr:hypothetical protein PMIN01_12169 [Paraphaeosphaeria minitans]